MNIIWKNYENRSLQLCKPFIKNLMKMCILVSSGYYYVCHADIKKTILCHYIVFNNTASKLQHLLVLESEHGPLPGTIPALADVLHYSVLCCIQYNYYLDN